MIEEIIKNAIDLHVHVGPEIIPRKYTAQSLAKSERGKLAGAVLKNHFYPTAAMFGPKDAEGIALYGSIVLNNAVEGMNPEAVYAASLIGNKPLMVWFPTINAEQFLRANKYEIAPEWVEDKSLKLKPAAETRPVQVTRNSLLLPQARAVIKMIAQVKGVLATGHIAAGESVLAARYARSLDVPVIVTHPIYQHIRMPLVQQKELAGLGCYMEQAYSMYSMDGIAIKDIAEQIRSVGPQSVVLSSDVGQTFSPSPSTALRKFAELLLNEGFGVSDIRRMMVDNPSAILESANV
jgi:hypothetical protein